MLFAYKINIISVRQKNNMSRSSIKTSINITKDKQNLQSRLTETSTVKTISRKSYTNSNQTSSSSSVANISISFLKDNNFPKLFNNSPMLFSFKPQPQTTKNSMLRNSIGFSSGLSSGSRTPSSSSYNSLNQGFSKDHLRKNSLFSKKSCQLNIDLNQKNGEKNQDRQKINNLCISKELKKYSNNRLEIQPYLQDSAPKLQNIKVFIRIKPSFVRDICTKPFILRLDDKHIDIQGKITTYDYIFSQRAPQQQVFQQVAKPVLSGLFQGYNGTIFAYGQTGSGKTHTIFGGPTEQCQGLISRSVKFIFSQMKNQSKICLSLLQIYKQELIDLLQESKNDLKIKQTCSGVFVEGLTKTQLKTVDGTLILIQNSLKNRRVASTKLNEKSSRSHTILTIYVETMEQQSKLCLIDLAGSQKANKAGVVGQNFEEMKKINYSLSCLGNVINALVTRKKSDHIPFRDSKLTRLLKDSLSGRFRTSIIVNCSSDPGTQDETQSSLKFADRAKKVKITISKSNAKGKQNVEYLQKVILQLTEDLEETKRQLNKYKQICVPKVEKGQKLKQHSSNKKQNFSKADRTQKQEYYSNKQNIEQNKQSHLSQSPQVTARQTIPSQRANLDNQMKKYGKECKKINVISLCQKQNQKNNYNLSQLSSLNISKSTIQIFNEIGSPSVSSLSYRPDEGPDDFSFDLTNIKDQVRGLKRN